MNFALNEEQQDLQDLARRIFGDRMTHEHLKEVEADPSWFDRATWAELAKANLLGVALPEELGGLGYGLIELCVLLVEAGRTQAPMPLLATLVSALAIDEFGSDEQRKGLLPGVVAGDVVLTAAVNDPGARVTGDKGGLRGEMGFVPFADSADRVLVPAFGGGLFLVDPKDRGVTAERVDTTSGEPQSYLTFDGAVAEPLPGTGADAGWLADRWVAGLCATAIGVCERALQMTAEYTSTREQFDRPLAANQAVAQRAADAYIDTEAIRLTAWQAIWRLAEGMPAHDELAVAKFWAADGGQRVVHAAQHLHGGIGVDLDYPLHRCFLWAKNIELTLGSATPQLVTLGRSLAENPV